MTTLIIIAAIFGFAILLMRLVAGYMRFRQEKAYYLRKFRALCDPNSDESLEFEIKCAEHAGQLILLRQDIERDRNGFPQGLGDEERRP